MEPSSANPMNSAPNVFFLQEYQQAKLAQFHSSNNHQMKNRHLTHCKKWIFKKSRAWKNLACQIAII